MVFYCCWGDVRSEVMLWNWQKIRKYESWIFWFTIRMPPLAFADFFGSNCYGGHTPRSCHHLPNNNNNISLWGFWLVFHERYCLSNARSSVWLQIYLNVRLWGWGRFEAKVDRQGIFWEKAGRSPPPENVRHHHPSKIWPSFYELKRCWFFLENSSSFRFNRKI